MVSLLAQNFLSCAFNCGGNLTPYCRLFLHPTNHHAVQDKGFPPDFLKFIKHSVDCIVFIFAGHTDTLSRPAVYQECNFCCIIYSISGNRTVLFLPIIREFTNFFYFYLLYSI